MLTPINHSAAWPRWIVSYREYFKLFATQHGSTEKTVNRWCRKHLLVRAVVMRKKG